MYDGFHKHECVNYFAGVPDLSILIVMQSSSIYHFKIHNTLTYELDGKWFQDQVQVGTQKHLVYEYMTVGKDRATWRYLLINKGTNLFSKNLLPQVYEKF